jgi:hypothetical protein
MVPADSYRISLVPHYSGSHWLVTICAYGVFTLSDSTFQKILLDVTHRMWSYNPHGARSTSLGSSLFARHYWGNHYYFLFHRVLRCISSPGWLPTEVGWYVFNISGCPIRKSEDLMLVCSSPQLIAAYHVLHRLLDPRHPPYTLIRFK